MLFVVVHEVPGRLRARVPGGFSRHFVPTLREALEAEGIPYTNDKDPILSRRYAVVTHYPFKGGCEICVLQSNCPKGQGQMEAASVVLPGYERPQL